MKKTFTQDEVQDIALAIVQKLIQHKLLPDCVDDETEFVLAQDWIAETLTESLNNLN